MSWCYQTLRAPGLFSCQRRATQVIVARVCGQESELYRMEINVGLGEWVSGICQYLRMQRRDGTADSQLLVTPGIVAFSSWIKGQFMECFCRGGPEVAGKDENIAGFKSVVLSKPQSPLPVAVRNCNKWVQKYELL